MTTRSDPFANLRWLVVFYGIADSCIWPIQADGWWLAHGSPANGALGILAPEGGDVVPTMTDALWLADALAFDHDAPVGVAPAVRGAWPEAVPADEEAMLFMQPVEALTHQFATQYWDSVGAALGAAADLRFGASYCLRYDSDYPDPGTGFTERFRGREELVAMYAMAARQADVLAEYLCLYRVLEGADRLNGTAFSERVLPTLLERDFGLLRVIPAVQYSRPSEYIDVFALYKHRARTAIYRIEKLGESDVPQHLYRIKNQIAHGKHRVLAGGSGRFFEDVAWALPVVKLLARAGRGNVGRRRVTRSLSTEGAGEADLRPTPTLRRAPLLLSRSNAWRRRWRQGRESPSPIP